MKHIRRSYVAVCAGVLIGLMGLASAQAAEIIPGDLTTGSSFYTTGDGKVTLTPYAYGLIAGTFGANANLFGVTGGNNNALQDTDGNPATTADREAINITLNATVGLSQISFVWARADGPLANDGIVISGFLEDPGATHSGAGTLSGNNINYSAGSLYLSIINWSGTPAVFDFSNLAASAGQTLRIALNDSDQSGPQASVSSLSYDTAPPPPSRLKLIGIH